MTFAGPVSGASLLDNSLGGLSITFNAYDNLNNLLQTISVTSATGTYAPVVFTAVGISRIDGLQPDDVWVRGFTDATPSPEGIAKPLRMSAW
jgi:hypothetical protein